MIRRKCPAYLAKNLNQDMKVLQYRSQVRDARKALVAEGLSSVESSWKSVLRRAGVRDRPVLGDNIKSWDVLESLRFLQQGSKHEPILDIGAYASELIVALHRAGFDNLTGVDLDPRLHSMPHRDAIKYEVCDFLDTPFADGSFSSITAISVIEHGFDSARLLSEMSRLLRPGGFFIASFDYWQSKIDTTGIKFFDMSWTIFSESEVRAFLVEAQKVGLHLVGDPQFGVSDPVVRCGGKRYTFGWLALQKR